jgi:hypothetical protein
MFKDEKLAEVRIEESWRGFIVRKAWGGEEFPRIFFPILYV